MMRNIWNLCIVACCTLLWAACTDNLAEPATGPEAGADGMELGDVVLRYKAVTPSEAAQEADTRAVARSGCEGHISSALYIFVADDVCVGATHLEDLDLDLSAGQLPLSTVGLKLVQGKTYQVYAVLNYVTYLTRNVTGSSLAESLVNLSMSEVKSLLSHGVVGTPTSSSDLTYQVATVVGTDGTTTYHSDLLYSSEFDFTFGQSTAYCEFQCLSTRLVLDLTRFPSHRKVQQVTIENIPLSTPWFDTNVSWDTPKMLPAVTLNVEPEKPQLNIYMLSNLSLSDKHYALKLTFKGTKEEVPYVETNADAGRNKYFGLDLGKVEPVSYQESVSILYSSDNYRFRPNQYADIHFFAPADNPAGLDYTVSSWPSAAVDASSRLMKYDGENNMVSVSLSSVTLDYASKYNASYALDGFPDGSVSKEVFISYTGFSPSWEATVISGTDWLRVEKSLYNNSFVLTAAPNFTVSADGGLRSTARRGEVQLTMYLGDGEEWRPTITVHQQVAPSFPGDVKLDNFTVRGANAGLNTYNFYWVGQDGNIKGSSEIGYLKDWTNANLSNLLGLRMLIGSGYSNENSLSTLTQIENLCPTGYRIPKYDEMYYHLLPRLRKTTQQVGGEEVTVFYLPGDGSFCFLPLIGSITKIPSAKYMVNNEDVPGISVGDVREQYCSGFELSTHSMLISSGSMRAGQVPTNHRAWGDVRCIK